MESPEIALRVDDWLGTSSPVVRSAPTEEAAPYPKYAAPEVETDPEQAQLKAVTERGKEKEEGQQEPDTENDSLLKEEEEYDEVDAVDLPEDTYCMIYLAPWGTAAFLYSLLIFSLQVGILVLAYSDMTADDPGQEDSNWLNVPPTGTTDLYLAQYIGLLLSVLSQDDVTNSLFFVSIGLGEDFPKHQIVLQKKYPGAATTWQYWLGNTLRFAEGMLTILVSFVFIVQSETVLDIFLNFAAIQFVSELDNLGFRLAKEGWFGYRLQSLARCMSGETLPTRKGKGCIYFFNRTLLFVTIAAMFGCYSVILAWKKNGHYINADACSVLNIQFGDEAFSLPVNASFKTYEVNGTEYFANSSRRVSSFFDPSDPPELRYAYFNNKYHADFENKAGIDNPRPVYYEAIHVFDDGLPSGGYLDHDDSSLGMFYYCEEEIAWVWTVRAFQDAGAVPSKTEEHCKYGWLLMSPITQAVTLEEVPTDSWRIWTGVLDFVSDLSFSCLECEKDTDCGLDRGTCGDDNICRCHDYAMGDLCHQDVPCEDLVDFVNSSITPVAHLRLAHFSYDRPVYMRIRDDSHVELLHYFGGRWFSYIGEISVDPNLSSHGYWDFAALPGSYWYSEPTQSFLPTGPMQWFEWDDSRSGGNYGAFGREIKKDYRTECLSVDCDSSHHVCGRYGKCEKGQTLEFQGQPVVSRYHTNQTAVGGNCICDEGYEGFFCEFKQH